VIPSWSTESDFLRWVRISERQLVLVQGRQEAKFKESTVRTLALILLSASEDENTPHASGIDLSTFAQQSASTPPLLREQIKLFLKILITY
jgi:hypothetical protein